MNRRKIVSMRDELGGCMLLLGNLLNFKNADHQEFVRTITTVAGVPETTLVKYLKGEDIPGGLAALSLMCCFTSMGFEVLELERKAQPHREYAELIGYHVVSVKSVLEAISYTNQSTLFTMLRKCSKLDQKREESFWQLWLSNRDAVETAKADFKRRLRPVATFASQQLKSGSIHHQDDEPSAPTSSEPMSDPLSVPPSDPQVPTNVMITRPTELFAILKTSRATLTLMQGLLELLEGGELDRLLSVDESIRSAFYGQTIPRLLVHFKTLNNALGMAEMRKGVPHVGNIADVRTDRPDGR